MYKIYMVHFYFLQCSVYTFANKSFYVFTSKSHLNITLPHSYTKIVNTSNGPEVKNFSSLYLWSNLDNLPLIRCSWYIKRNSSLPLFFKKLPALLSGKKFTPCWIKIRKTVGFWPDIKNNIADLIIATLIKTAKYTLWRWKSDKGASDQLALKSTSRCVIYQKVLFKIM